MLIHRSGCDVGIGALFQHEPRLRLGAQQARLEQRFHNFLSLPASLIILLSAWGDHFSFSTLLLSCIPFVHFNIWNSQNPDAGNEIGLVHYALVYRKLWFWVTASNIVFVDSPAGVGYSYSNTSSDYNYLDDDLTGTCALHSFISEFFIECNE